MQRIQVIDSHTGGEPTRIVVDSGLDLGSGSVRERCARLEQQDWFRSAVVCEPRGSDAVVGGLLCEPQRDDCDFGIIYFNNVGYLNMCVHGTIGLGVTLAHLGKIESGRRYAVETNVGVVSLEWEVGNHVTVHNVNSYRTATDVILEMPDGTRISGDVAWGGNWFFLTEDHGQQIQYSNRERLLDYAWEIRRSIERAGISGENDGEIDHIELFAPSQSGAADSRNFVLCPGRQYDRSPCGTGTSAKLACLQARGKLAPGEVWRQESIVGSLFEGSYEEAERGIIPRIRGSAFITAEATLVLDPSDAFRHGIPG